MVKDFLDQSAEMLEAAGLKDITKYDTHQAPGLDIHEMGGCRMGQRSENLPTQQMEPAAPMQQCVRD